MELYEAAERFVSWLETVTVTTARGDEIQELEVEPSGRFWLGRLAPETAVIELGLGDRGERIDPCAIGLRVRPRNPGPWRFTTRIRLCAWLRQTSQRQHWEKSAYFEHTLDLEVPDTAWGDFSFGSQEIAAALSENIGVTGLAAEVRVEVEQDSDGQIDLTITLVNVSAKRSKGEHDSNLYECQFEISGLEVEPYILESLPDSFRYDRDIIAYGINCGIERAGNDSIRTTDAISVRRGRPQYWNAEPAPPDLSFEILASDPLPSLQLLSSTLTSWGESHWHKGYLRHKASRENWSEEMLTEALSSADAFSEEKERIERGVRLLEEDPDLYRAFRLMNRAIAYSAQGKYDSWRAFQIGFLVANLSSITDPSTEEQIADVVWFATGGGKTETYLGLLIAAAFYDRIQGKRAGITAWSRFPLRMLSLQQTQRFADAMAAAEIVRREEAIPGEPFGVGFLVGNDATPNAIPIEPKEGQPDPDDENMPARYQVLSSCPFCHQKSISMLFNRRQWRLEHRCTREACPWPEEALPFFVVDEEVFRFLPTIVVGTLDKAASISMQAAMRGLIGPPWGRCSRDSHGYTYAPRSSRPKGCLVPGCDSTILPLDMAAEKFGPSFRLQDELHLLRDSLGAVDAHYETLFDSLQTQLCGRRPKILASSATLTGYENQVEVLYRRRARVFPVPGPSATKGFWTAESRQLARAFVALAPRGVTLEFAVDRILTELQRAVRRLHKEPEVVCAEAGVPIELADDLLSLYGVDLVYGNTLRDLEAAARSIETQIAVEGPLNSASLTGKTNFEEVRQTIERLEKPEGSFDERLHVIAASSMMSHGVDIDRLNVMIVLGLPLTTAEFIQATARVGRRWPGLVFVIPKITRERDAGIYRSFEKFVQQGDRFVEPIPITRRSRRVLERTLPGIALARAIAIHEPNSKESLATVRNLRRYFASAEVSIDKEVAAAIEALGLDRELDELMISDLEEWYRRFYQNLEDPGGTYRFPSELAPKGGPMRSLRDVEEQAPIIGVLKP